MGSHPNVVVASQPGQLQVMAVSRWQDEDQQLWPTVDGRLRRAHDPPFPPLLHPPIELERGVGGDQPW